MNMQMFYIPIAVYPTHEHPIRTQNGKVPVFRSNEQAMTFLLKIRECAETSNFVTFNTRIGSRLVLLRHHVVYETVEAAITDTIGIDA